MASPHLIQSARVQEALAYMESVDPEPAHARQVHRLMRSILYSSRDLHRFTPVQVAMAEAAALLHDIGWSRSHQLDGKGHHKHSAAMIREKPWTNFSPIEAELTAQIARYHRKRMPGVKHREFVLLSPGEQEFVCRAASLLRLADALDRSHKSLILEARMEAKEDQWMVLAWTHAAAGEEPFGFEKKKDLFERTFDCPIKLSLQQGDPPGR